jgi:multidrug transporter EmrE-like cation transporter
LKAFNIQMSLQALLLVITAAILHAIWNLVTKQVNGKLPFFWLIGAISSLICIPFVLWQLLQQDVSLTPMVWMFALVSAMLHAVYFLILQAGYRKADLSVVYPLARGSGPFISVIGAIIFFNERPGWLALIGVLLIIGWCTCHDRIKIPQFIRCKIESGYFVWKFNRCFYCFLYFMGQARSSKQPCICFAHHICIHASSAGGTYTYGN